MNRKQKPWFIYSLCLGLAIAFAIASLYAPSTLTPQTVTSHLPTSIHLRGVWLTNVGSAVMYVPWGINRALSQLAKLNFNTVYPVVWNRGHTFYPSNVAKRATGRSQEPLLRVFKLGQDVLAAIAKQGHEQGLRVIPWFEYGFMAPANSVLAQRHPDWLTTPRDSTKMLKEGWKQQDLGNFNSKVPHLIRKPIASQAVWLNPLHPEVQQFILDLIVEVVTKYDLDGIQLDDHFGMPVDLGYDSFTIKLYQQEHEGKSPPNNPLDSEWMRWRADKITDFMRRVFQSVKAVKRDRLVTLSPNPQYFAYTAYLQDWQTWIKLGLIEELVCQVYREDLKTFVAELEQPSLEIARRQIPVGIGILTGSWNNPVTVEQIGQQVQAVEEHNFNGVSFFYWESLWGYIAPESPRERRAAFQALFSANAVKPERLHQVTSSTGTHQKLDALAVIDKDLQVDR